MNESIKLQAVVTSDKIFTNITAGFPGSAHDSRVLQNSRLYQEVEEEDHFNRYFYNEENHLVGDSAYTLHKWLMTPFRNNGNLNNAQLHHNTCLSITRIVVEHTFGLLKTRWRILHYINVNSVEKAVKIIVACCVLHNFCFVKHDIWNDNEIENNFNDQNGDLNHFRGDNAAVNKRNRITQNLNL